MRLLVGIATFIAVAACLPLKDSTPADVTGILNAMVSHDTSRATTSQVVLNYQNQASHHDFSHDNSKFPLFKSVDESLNSIATYKALLNLQDLFQVDASLADPQTSLRNSSWDQFYAVVTQTNVYVDALQFLISQGLTKDGDSFKDQVYQLWMTMFARKIAAGSCGFEAVFVGEFLIKNVVGLSNWIRFHNLEALNQIDYHGWFERQKDVQISLQFALTVGSDVKKAMISPVLFDSSPEFELMAYTICAMAQKGQCSYMVDGHEVVLNVVTRNENGVTTIDNAYPSIGSTPPSTGTTTRKPYTPSDGATTTKSPNPSGGGDLQKLVDSMRAADVDKASSSQYQINWGKHISGHAGPTGTDLLANVDESVFTRKVYDVLNAIYQNNLLNPDVCVAESDINSGFKKSAYNALLNAWADTDVFKLMHTYLVNAGKADADITKFKAFLYTFWFGTYSRCRSNKNILGSSGFEHVFSGEWKSGTVDGQHNWMKFYQCQKAGDISYYGYYSHDAQLTGTFEYKWKDELKKKGGFLIGTSPVFDYSLFTVCALTESGANKCRFAIDGFNLAVTSYTQECANGGKCLSTSYPVDEV